ncbi:MAG: hypothetical protein ACXABY_05430 [Candidatus Thorarchaeota archaeon]|jgi:hypothetical protein
MFDGKKVVEQAESIGSLKAKLELLEKENARLWEQNGKLQEALIAKESPQAYAMIKHDEACATGNTDQQEAAYHKFMEEQSMVSRLAAMHEGPTFRDADELVAGLSRVIGVPKFESLHGNDES